MMQDELVTKEMFLEWKSHPVTKWVFRELDRRKEVFKDRLLGSPEFAEIDRIAGYAGAIDDFINIEYGDEE